MSKTANSELPQFRNKLKKADEDFSLAFARTVQKEFLANERTSGSLLRIKCARCEYVPAVEKGLRQHIELWLEGGKF